MPGLPNKRRRDLSPIRHVILVLILCFNFFTAWTQKEEKSNVYVTETGKKYHLEHCRYLKYSRYEISLKEAVKKGYGACLVCKPDKVVSLDTTKQTQTTPNTNNIKYATSRRCIATTQAGSRCKRMTKNTSQKCWQHE